ncbi:MAG: hypothetical protein IT378_24820 [Sandaracinaceae bacterium]|nr:hypothetical protein [Sandaracinaceae bacterium]
MRFALVLGLALVACDGTPSTLTDGGLDGGEALADAGTDAGPRPPDVCDELGLPRRPFQTTGTGSGQGEVASDFTLQTLAGPWRFAEQWSGCESYVFLVYIPDLRATPSGPWIGDALFATGLDQLYLEGSRTTRFVILSDEPDAAARTARMQQLASDLDEGLRVLLSDPAERDFWRPRFHFVTDRATAIDGGPGAYLRDYFAYLATPESIVDLGKRGRAQAPLPFVFGIDRAQRFDPGGSLDPVVGQPAQLGMAAYLGHYYDFRATLEDRLAAETGVTVVTLVDERTTARVLTPSVELPRASAMQAFSSLEVDVEIVCDERNPFACSEWDRIANVSLCADGAACTDRREIARWITPYWRRGRQHWTIDASPMLGLLRAGGTQVFRVELGPDSERATEWVARVALRLRAEPGAPRATETVLAFRGGLFDASYNARAPFTFSPPASSTRVELVTILSGHGQTAGDNCAEWCDHRHTFSVNGTALPAITHEGNIGSARGCARRAGEGVLPGQWGNWAPERAYWCPGLPVEARRTDITSQVTLGADNALEYQAALGTSAPRGGDIALSAYVVWYTD